LFSPDRQYTVSGDPSGFPGTFGLAPGTVESGSTLFGIPSFGANWMGGDNSSFGVALYGNGGMNTDYNFRTFGWQDTTVYKFGVHFTSHPGLTWMDGYSYQNQPIPESAMLFNIVAPGVEEQHLTFGVSKSIGIGKAIDFALMRAFRNSIDGPNALEAPGFQSIELAMSQWEFDISFSFGF
jgi:long-chain fatty acid transport protein